LHLGWTSMDSMNILLPLAVAEFACRQVLSAATVM